MGVAITGAIYGHIRVLWVQRRACPPARRHRLTPVANSSRHSGPDRHRRGGCQRGPARMFQFGIEPTAALVVARLLQIRHTFHDNGIGLAGLTRVLQ